MYVVIATGGKQYKVAEGQTLQVEKLDVEPGADVEFANVLLLENGADIKVGAPYVAGVKVLAEVIEQGRGKKIKIIKFRRRKHSMKQMGHRQSFTELKIKSIQTAEDVTAEDVAAEDVATEDVAAEDVTTEDVATEDVTTEDVKTEDVEAKQEETDVRETEEGK